MRVLSVETDLEREQGGEQHEDVKGGCWGRPGWRVSVYSEIGG